MFQNTVQTKE